MSASTNLLLSLLLLGGAAAWPAQAAAPQPAAPARKVAPRPKPRHRGPDRRLDVNSASKAQLAKLPGLNDALAAQIIAHRPYLTKEHLVLNGVIPQALFLSIRARLTCVPPRNWQSLAEHGRPAGK